MGDMMIPFIMLLIITIALVLERRYHEEKIAKEYDEKFENWKKHNDTNPSEKKHKELVGLVFLEKYQLSIEILDEKVLDQLQRKKYTIKKLLKD